MVDVVFGNVSALPARHSAYWSETRLPHFVSVDRDEDGRMDPPRGWQCFAQELLHSQCGGSTDGRSTVLAFLHSDQVAAQPLARSPPPQSWRPLVEKVNTLNKAVQVPEELRPTVPLAIPAPVWNGADLLPWGLFPAGSPQCFARVPCQFNVPSRWGRRRFSAHELALLWDTPIGMCNWASANGLEAVLRGLVASSPGKTLTLGCDFLYSLCVRGGC